MTGDQQTPEEIAAQASDDGPMPTLTAWLQAVRRVRVWGIALGLMTPELRLTCARAFVRATEELGNPTEEGAAEALAAGDRAHPAYESFCASWQRLMDLGFAGWPERLAFGSRPRLVDLDHEILVVVPYADVAGPVAQVAGVGEVKQLRSADPAPDRQMGFLMRREPETPGGWLVAGWRHQRLPEVHWPTRSSNPDVPRC